MGAELTGDVLGAPFLTVAEVAGRMRVSKMTVYRLVHSGELPAVRFGRSFRVQRAAVEELTPQLLATSHDIHANPELAFREHRACARLADELEEGGFTVERWFDTVRGTTSGSFEGTLSTPGSSKH